jgi:hypothetical protein
MPDQIVHVECYSGYRADERPVRLKLRDRVKEILTIEDRWYEPGATYFRVVVDDGDRYLLRHEEAQDIWIITGYRSGSGSVSG